MSETIGIWPVREQAERIASVLAQKLDARVFRPWTLPGPQKEEFRRHFSECSHWVLIMASGIAVRFMDGLLLDKHSDPAVVVVDEGARHAVVLAGGHEGGANMLAYRVANAVNALPVITTATEALKPLVVGIGCRKGVSEAQIETAMEHALKMPPADFSQTIREVATVDLKAQEPGLIGFCATHGLALRIVTRAQIAARSWVTQPSEWVRESVGVDGVCEPCALIASIRGKLVVPKTALDGVAVAVVEDIPEYTT